MSVIVGGMSICRKNSVNGIFRGKQSKSAKGTGEQFKIYIFKRKEKKINQS